MEEFKEYKPVAHHSPEVGGKKPAFWINTYAYCEARVCPETEWERKHGMSSEKYSDYLKDIASEMKLALNTYAEEKYGDKNKFSVYADGVGVRVQMPGHAFTEEDWQHITGTVDTINELID